METKAFYSSFLCILPGLCLSGFIPLNDAIKNAGWEILLSHWILIPAYLLIAYYVASRIFHIAQYTDEFLPFQLSIVAIAFSMLGVWLTPRLLVLGMILLIVSAYWCRGTVYQYYNKQT